MKETRKETGSKKRRRIKSLVQSTVFHNADMTTLLAT